MPVILLIKLSLAGTETVRGQADIQDTLAQNNPPFQTASSLMSFFVAALLRPEIQTIAQKELDAVTGRERLPTFEDRSRLPFVDAICKEISRWRPVVPMGELLPSTPLRLRKSMTIHRCTACNHSG